MNDNDSETGPLSRALLKGFFKNNAIPTVKNFAALIDGMLNQADDGIFKSKDGTLSLKAVDDAKPTQTLLNFCERGQDSPAWKFQLIPIPGQPATAKLGFSISDGEGVSRLFIDPTGTIGIGTKTPKGKLDIAGILWIGADSEVKSINFVNSGGDQNDAPKITYNGGPDTDPFKIFGARSSGSRTINLFDHVTVQGNLAVTNEATVSGGLQVTGNTTIQGQAGIGTDQPAGKLDIAGVLCIGLNGQKSISFARASPDDANAGTISYKGGVATDNALSLYGAGTDKKRAIKLYDNVEITGRINVYGQVIRKVKVKTEFALVEITDLDDRGQVLVRAITFNKLHRGSAIRIVYFDNLYCEHYHNYLRMGIKIKGNEAMHLFADFRGVGEYYIYEPVVIFGYIKDMPEGEHEVQIWVSKHNEDKAPSKVAFGRRNAFGFIEAQEIWI